MSESNRPARGDRSRAISVAAYAAVHAFISWTLFAWFMWKVVPVQLAMIEGAKVPVLAVTRAVEAVSSWFVRLLPAAFVLSLLVGVVVAGIVAGLLLSGVTSAGFIRRAGTGLLLGIALAGTAADAFVIWAMNYPIATAIESLNERPPADAPR